MKINQKHLVYFEKWFISWFIFGLFLVYSWFIFEINQISFKSFGHWEERGKKNNWMLEIEFAQQIGTGLVKNKVSCSWVHVHEFFHSNYLVKKRFKLYGNWIDNKIRQNNNQIATEFALQIWPSSTKNLQLNSFFSCEHFFS